MARELALFSLTGSMQPSQNHRIGFTSTKAGTAHSPPQALMIQRLIELCVGPINNSASIW
jgi:hypothetical protein